MSQPAQTIFSAFITYKGDASVRIADRIFAAEIPDFREGFADHEKIECREQREIVRDEVKRFYQFLDDE